MNTGTDENGVEKGSMHAILLAAGLSRRMGKTNKLLVEIDGEPMVRRAAQTLIRCGLPLIVVVGHDHERVEAALSDLSAEIVFNPDYSSGQAGSVRSGLKALPGGHGAVLIALSDQPRLDEEDIASLREAFERSPGDRILVPFFGGERGNPIIVPRQIIKTIGAGPAQFACRKFIEANPSQILRFEARNDHFILDIDTRDTLAALAH